MYPFLNGAKRLNGLNYLNVLNGSIFLYRRHLARDAVFSHLVFVVCVNVRVFVGIFDQGAAFFHVDINAVLTALVGDLETARVKPAAVAQREMARRLGAGVEMLMKPAARRAIDAARFPFYLDDIFVVPGFVGPGAELLRP